MSGYLLFSPQLSALKRDQDWGVGALTLLHEATPSLPVLSVSSLYPQQAYSLYSSIHLIETTLQLAYHHPWQHF